MSFPLLKLPAEIRDIVYEHVLHPSLNRTKDRNSYIHYRYNLSLFRTCKAVHDEAERVFYMLNHFAKISTPWRQAQDAIKIEGFVPILIRDRVAAQKFSHHSLTVVIDTPRHDFPPDRMEHMIIHVDDLPAFADFWMYQDLTYGDFNSHMKLTLQLRLQSAHARVGDEGNPLPKALQRQLLEPFSELRNLQGFIIEGEHYSSIEKEIREAMARPYRSPEECLDEAAGRKDQGNALLEKGDYRGAIKMYEDSFRSLHIICDGRRRSVFGEWHFQGEMTSGRFKGANGSIQRLIMRVRLVANIVYAFLKLEEFAWAKFWGKRTIQLFRNEVDIDEDEDDEVPHLFDFPASNEMGKIFYRTGVAYKQLGKRDKARRMLKIASLHLPNDPQVRQEHASVALRLG